MLKYAASIGDTFGRLVVTELATITERSGKQVRAARVACECGTVKVVRVRPLVLGVASSCGCGRGRKREKATPAPRGTPGEVALAPFRKQGFGPGSSRQDRDQILRELSGEATCRELADFFGITPYQAWMIAAKEWFDALSAAA